MKKQLLIAISAFALALGACGAAAQKPQDGQVYFGKAKDLFVIATNGYTRAQVDDKIADAVKDAGRVQSVNAQTGAVVITAASLGAVATGDFATATNALAEAIAKAAPADYAAVSNAAMTALQPSATNGLASQSSLTSLSSRVDAKRDKTDLAVYAKFAKWYIVATSGDGILAEPIEMYDYGGYTFQCTNVNVSGDALHPHRITCDTRYGEDGKVSGVSGGGEAYYPPTGEYTTGGVYMDPDAVNFINDPANGEFSAIVQYFDADGNVQNGMVRFRVTYTGGPHELTDTLATTDAIPTTVSALSDAGDYLKTADLAKEAQKSLTTADIKNADPAGVMAGGAGNASEETLLTQGSKVVSITPEQIIKFDTNSVPYSMRLYQWPETDGTLATLSDIPVISATDPAFSSAVNAAARALVKAKLESLDKAKSSIGETIAALQSIYTETETK